MKIKVQPTLLCEAAIDALVLLATLGGVLKAAKSKGVDAGFTISS